MNMVMSSPAKTAPIVPTVANIVVRFNWNTKQRLAKLVKCEVSLTERNSTCIPFISFIFIFETHPYSNGVD